jgi:hypothetical protein
MKNTGKCGDTKQKNLRCPKCGNPIETETFLRTRFGAIRSMSAAPGELTRCEHCPLMLEYGGRPGALTVQRARPERVRAFQERERERPAQLELPALVDYVVKFRTMPTQAVDRTSGRIRFTICPHS